jgi:hypothetical protein
MSDDRATFRTLSDRWNSRDRERYKTDAAYRYEMKKVYRDWFRASYAPDPATTIDRLTAELAAKEKEIARLRALSYGDWDEKPLPEDAAIEAAHPMNGGDGARYMEAMRLVGARRSKGALVELVNWLLARTALQPEGNAP